MVKYLIALVLISGVLYGGVKAWPLIAGPRLIIDSPKDNMVVVGGTLSIAGQALRTGELTLDGALLLHDQNGTFSSTLTFPSGGSILTFVAVDRFGRRVTAERHIFVP